MPTPTVINKYRYSDVINRRYWDKYFFSNMSINPVISMVGGGAATGADTETDVWTDGKSIFEYYNINGNANLGPTLDGSFGLNLATDATDTNGVEYNTGTTSQNNFTFLIDQTGSTTPAFFLQGQFNVSTVAGATLLLGFRILSADNDDYTTYTDYATIGIIPSGATGNFQIDTQKASGGDMQTDTTELATDATLFQVGVFVDSFGKVTYEINGSAPTVTVAYQFQDGITVMPFLLIVQNSTTTATASCNYFECGFQS